MKTLTLAAICFLTTAASPGFADEAKPLPPCQPAATTAKPATAAEAGAQTAPATEPDKTADSTASSTQVNVPADGGLQTPDRRVVMNTGQITGNPAVKCKPVVPPVTPPQ